MLIEEVVLKDVTEFVTAGDQRAWVEVGRDESVLASLVQRGQIDTARHEDGLRKLGDRLKRSLNSIEDSLQDA